MLFVATQAFANPLDPFQDCDACPVMIELPLGSFLMGAPEDEFRRNLVWRDGGWHRATPENPHVKTDEGPQGIVEIDIPIAMGRDEVTYDQWMACVDDGGCDGYIPRSDVLWFGKQYLDRRDRYPAKGNHPVMYVSLVDAVNYTNWLSDKTGEVYRLATKAEWEYAARAGTTTPYAQGETITSEQVNFHGEQTERVMMETLPQYVTRGVPVPVDQLDAANAWGLRHMSGNITEMTLSCYSEVFVIWSKSSAWLDNVSSAGCEKRAVRGGSFAGPIDAARVAWRGGSGPSDGSRFVGFRVIRELN